MRDRIESRSAPVDGGLVDKRLGNHKVLRLIASGGMGEVYEAEHILLQRRVAIKILPRVLSGDHAAMRRFIREAQSAAQLNHPNVVQIYEVGEQDGIFYIVMELVQGGSAEDFLNAKGPMNWPDATRVVAEVCRGLIAAHAAKLIHRDIKPANIMRSKVDGRVKLTDFGLARSARSGKDSLVGTGMTVGTPHYMSPEQCRAEELDSRSDIYSLGATYYTLLAGKPPFDAETPMQILHLHLEKPIPDPRQIVASIDPRCVHIIKRAMAKDRNNRYPTAQAMLADLEVIINSQDNASTRRTGWLTYLRNTPEPTTTTPIASAVTGPQPRALLIGGLVGAGIGLLTVVVGAFLWISTRSNNTPTTTNTLPTVVATTPNTTPIPKSILLEQAANHLNEFCEIEFVVRGASQPSPNGPVFLNSEKNFRSPTNFAARFTSDLVAKFKEERDLEGEQLLQRFEGKRVRVTGRVTRTSTGGTQISVDRMENIRLISD